jgi:hypothetical protein
MSQEDYNKKYLKYKAKYFSLKNQKGGVVCPRCGKEPCECYSANASVYAPEPLPYINIEILLNDILQNFNPPYVGVISLAKIPKFRETMKNDLRYIINTLKAKEPLFETLVDEDWNKFLNLCKLLIFQEKMNIYTKNIYNKLSNEKKLPILTLISLGLSNSNMISAIGYYNIEKLEEIISLSNYHHIHVDVAFKALKERWSIEKINKYKYVLNKGLPASLVDAMFNFDLNDEKIEKFIQTSRSYPDVDNHSMLGFVLLNMTPEQITSYLQFKQFVGINVRHYLYTVYPMTDAQKNLLIQKVSSGINLSAALIEIIGTDYVPGPNLVL